MGQQDRRALQGRRDVRATLALLLTREPPEPQAPRDKLLRLRDPLEPPEPQGTLLRSRDPQEPLARLAQILR